MLCMKLMYCTEGANNNRVCERERNKESERERETISASEPEPMFARGWERPQEVKVSADVAVDRC